MLFWKALFFIIILLPSISVIHLVSASVSLEKKLLSPRQQIAYGTSPESVVCFEGLVLIKKISDNSPACVKLDTAQKLVERGWGFLNEQMVWFEYTPLQCQQTPWDEHWNKLEGARNVTSVINKGPELGVIKMYFKDQGIIIMDAKYTPSMDISQGIPQCGVPIKNYAFYFLVLGSDANKMSSLGYTKVDVIPSSALSVEGLR